MDIFNWIFILIMILGFILIIISILKINKYSNATPISNIDNSIKQIKNIIDQADLAMDDLNLMSEQIFEKFDEKQKQLLFLYETIENKKPTSNKIDFKADENLLYKNIYKKSEKLHPMADKILEMSKQNMSVAEIAKALNIGQGEVELIIKFRRDSL